MCEKGLASIGRTENPHLQLIPSFLFPLAGKGKPFLVQYLFQVRLKRHHLNQRKLSDVNNTLKISGSPSQLKE